MVDAPYLVRQDYEFLGRHAWHRSGIGYANFGPYIEGVTRSAEDLQTRVQPKLFAFQGVEAEAKHCFDKGHRRVPEGRCRIVDKDLRPTDEMSVLPAHRAPHQSSIPGIELFNTTIRLDDLGAGHGKAALLGNHQCRTATSRKTATTVATRASANQTNDLDARGSRFDGGPHNFGDRKLSCICFLESHATGIKENEDRPRFHIPRGAQKARKLGTMYFTKGAAHESAFLSRNEYR
jgi:hypothetical protein